MSINGGPSTCRRSARSRNVSESSESSWLSTDRGVIASISMDLRCQTDTSSSSTDKTSPDKAKRKKRRKNEYELGLKKVIKKRVIELVNKRSLEHEFYKFQLQHQRIPIVLLTRIEDNRHIKQKFPKRVQKKEKQYDQKVESDVKEQKEEKIDERIEKRDEKVEKKADENIENNVKDQVRKVVRKTEHNEEKIEERIKERTVKRKEEHNKEKTSENLEVRKAERKKKIEENKNELEKKEVRIIIKKKLPSTESEEESEKDKITAKRKDNENDELIIEKKNSRTAEKEEFQIEKIVGRKNLRSIEKTDSKITENKEDGNEERSVEKIQENEKEKPVERRTLRTTERKESSKEENMVERKNLRSVEKNQQKDLKIVENNEIKEKIESRKYESKREKSVERKDSRSAERKNLRADRKSSILVEEKDLTMVEGIKECRCDKLLGKKENVCEKLLITKTSRSADSKDLKSGETKDLRSTDCKSSKSIEGKHSKVSENDCNDNSKNEKITGKKEESIGIKSTRRKEFKLVEKLNKHKNESSMQNKDYSQKEDSIRIEEERKNEQSDKRKENCDEKTVLCIPLPSVSGKAISDPKILCNPLIKIDKTQTDRLVQEIFKKRQQKQSLEDIADNVQNKQKSASLVVNNDSIKCKERLTKKLDNLSDDNKCTKKTIVSDCITRLARISVDKVNIRLPDRLLVDSSKSSSEKSMIDNQSESFKKFIPSNRKFECALIDQNNDNDSKCLNDSEPKNAENFIQDSNKKDSEDTNKSFQYDENNKICPRSLGDKDIKLSKTESIEKPEVILEKNKNIEDEVFSKKSKRNLIGKSSKRHIIDSILSNSLEQTNDIAIELNKDIRNIFENHKVDTQKIVNKNDSIIDRAAEKNTLCKKVVIEVDNFKVVPKLNKKNVCSKNDIDSNIRNLEMDNHKKQIDKVTVETHRITEKELLLEPYKTVENITKIETEKKITRTLLQNVEDVKNLNRSTLKNDPLYISVLENKNQDNKKRLGKNDSNSIRPQVEKTMITRNSTINKCEKHENLERTKSNLKVDSVEKSLKDKRNIGKDNINVEETNLQSDIEPNALHKNKVANRLNKNKKIQVQNKIITRNSSFNSYEKCEKLDKNKSILEQSIEKNLEEEKIIIDNIKNLKKNDSQGSTDPMFTQKNKDREITKKPDENVESHLKIYSDDKTDVKNSTDKCEKYEILAKTVSVVKEKSIDKTFSLENNIENFTDLNESNELSNSLQKSVQEKDKIGPKNNTENIKNLEISSSESKSSNIFVQEHEDKNAIVKKLDQDHVSGIEIIKKPKITTRNSSNKCEKHENLRKMKSDLKDTSINKNLFSEKNVENITDLEKCNSQNDSLQISAQNSQDKEKIIKKLEKSNKNCCKVQVESKIITRNKSNKCEKYENLKKSDLEDNGEIPLSEQETHDNIKKPKLDLEKFNTHQNLSCAKYITEQVNNLEKNNSKKNSFRFSVRKNNSKEIITKRLKKYKKNYLKMQVKNKIVTRNSSNKLRNLGIDKSNLDNKINITENLKNLKENELQSNSLNITAQENKNKIKKMLQRNLKNCSKSQLENKTYMSTRRSSIKFGKNQNLVIDKKLLNYDNVTKESSCTVSKKCSKIYARKSKLLNDHEKPIENFIKKNTNIAQNIIYNSNEKLEISKEVVKECSRSQTENNKRVTRKSSPDKHERLASTIKMDSQNILKEKEDMIVDKEQKANDKNATEPIDNNKRITRKLSVNKHDKHTDSGTATNLNLSQNSAEKKVISHKDSHQLLKKCQKNENEISKKGTRKTGDKVMENSYVNNLNTASNLADKNENILSDKLDNKENSKTQIENTRVTRSSPLKKDKYSKNFVENSIDCIQNLQEDKDKNLENGISDDTTKLICKGNIDNSTKIRKNSVDKVNEIQSEEVMEINLTPQNLIDPIASEKSVKQQKSIIHINFSSTQHLIDTISDKYPTVLEENKKNSLHVVNDNKRSTRLSEKLSENTVETAFQDTQKLEKHFENDVKNETYFKSLSRSESVEGVVEETSSKNNSNVHNANIKVSAQISSTSNHDKQKIENIDTRIQKQTGNLHNMKNQENSIKETTVISDGNSIKFSSENIKLSKKSFENKRITRHSLKRSEIHSESSLIDATVEAEENADDYTRNSSHNSNEYLLNSIESNKNNILTNDINDIISEKTFECKSNLIEDSIADNVNNVKISSSKRITLSPPHEPEGIPGVEVPCDNNVITESQTFFETTEENRSEGNTVFDVSGNLVEGAIDKQRRKVTLMELKKKCTENLDKKRLEKQRKTADAVIDETIVVNCLESEKNESTADVNKIESDTESFNSDENLESRLARLNGLEIPPIDDNLDSGVQSPSDDQQRVVEKIVLRCPRSSFLKLSSEIHCKYCEKNFITNRDLKKHVKEQHRQRLVIKITKTEANEHVTHMVEPLVSPLDKQSSNEEDEDDEEEDDDSNDDSDNDEEDEEEAIPTRFGGESSEGRIGDSSDHITEGEIKIIVKKESGSRNSHVVKEIKITPRTPSDSGNSSCRLPSCSPAKSDLSGGSGSCRFPTYSPAKSDLGQSIVVNPPRKRGRPRKYPIFTESELIAKQLAAVAATTPPSVPPSATSIVNNGVYAPCDVAESIIVHPDIVFNNVENVVLNKNVSEPVRTQLSSIRKHSEKQISSNDQDKTDFPSTEQMAADAKSVAHEQSESEMKRKRTRTLSGDNVLLEKNNVSENVDTNVDAIDDREKIVQDEKRPKMDGEIEESSMSSSLCESTEFLDKYDIKKELVVKLTKIDVVPKVNKESNSNASEVELTDEDTSNPSKVDEKIRRKTKPRVAFEDQQESNGCDESIASAIKTPRSELEHNNNTTVDNDAQKCLEVPASPSKTILSETELNKASNSVEAANETSQDSIQQLAEETLNKLTRECAELGVVALETSLDDNEMPVSESQPTMIPEQQTESVAVTETCQQAEFPASKNTVTRDETPVSSNIPVIKSVEIPQTSAFRFPQLQQSPPPLAPISLPPLVTQQTLQTHQSIHIQQQPLQNQSIMQTSSLQLLPPQQQFCILFIPDALYNSDSPLSKEMTPTATLVNFQPVPDSEIANKPLIFTPTTSSKIASTTATVAAATSTPDDPVRTYTCSACAAVLDLIGRLEASLGMTEEDKSAIKCPYCSNHFQSLFYLEYHLMQEHLKCENEKQCRHGGFSSLRIPSHETASEFEIYITFALKCRSCYDIFGSVIQLNDHVMHKHKTLVRFKPSMSPASSAASSAAALAAAYPTFARKNGNRTTFLQCPSDCVCRVGIRSTDSPLQRQEMIRRCPSAMRRLEKIERAAYEVYTCTLCNSTFLMKDEVIDHLMKMHEVSCKFPCYTCLTSFRTLQIQENHHCSETTLQDIDKLLNIAILPTNVGATAPTTPTTPPKVVVNNKFTEREESSPMEEYGAIKPVESIRTPPTSPSPKSPLIQPTPIQSQPQLQKNGYKRKNGATMEAIRNLLGMHDKAKRAKLQDNSDQQPQAPTDDTKKKKYKRMCPRCDKCFTYRKNLLHHVMHEHILSGECSGGPKKKAVELLRLMGKHFEHDEFTKALKSYQVNGIAKNFLNGAEREEEENCRKIAATVSKELYSKELSRAEYNAENPENYDVSCNRCHAVIKVDDSAHYTRRSKLKRPLEEPTICETCLANGPKTRRSMLASDDPEGLQIKIVHPFVCKKCGETYPTLLELKAHKRSVHAKYICEICQKAFLSIGMREKHKRHQHKDVVLAESSKAEEGIAPSEQSANANKEGEPNDSLNDKTLNSSSRRDSSDSSSGSKEPEVQLLNCSFCEEVCSSKVTLKNHLKREHGRRASICQFCNGLLIDTSEVRHMLDYHIVPSKSNPRRTIIKNNGSIFQCDEVSCMEDDVEELVRVLGRHRLQSLMMYHDFEGKCNNAIMRCPICPELFATRESCRFHYVWIHDDSCLLCDEIFRSGSSACQHKVTAHTSTASYLWCIQRLVTAIVNTLRLDPGQPSHVLYQTLVTRLEALEQEQQQVEVQDPTLNAVNGTVEQNNSAENTAVPDRFLEEVVLSEDQLPDSGNMIEVVIGKDDSEDDLLSMLNLSPNYESSCEQHKLSSAGAVLPGEEEEEDEEEEEEEQEEEEQPRTSRPSTPATTLTNVVPTTPPTVVLPTTTVATTVTAMPSPTVESYVASGVCKYRLENDEEQFVLVVTDEDLITYKDDIGSLAEKISATCDSLTLGEITEMLRAYFEGMSCSIADA